MLSEISEIRFVEVEGRRIAYREAGRGNGSPLVLLHAFASSSATWIPLVNHLAAAGFRVIAFDLPGHGQSDWLGHYSLASMEDSLASALSKLDLHRFDLVGHSLGGHLAMRLGARLTGNIGRLVVEAAPVPPRDETDSEAMMRAHAKPSLWQSIRLLGFGRLARIALFRQFDFKAAKPILSELKKPMPDWWSSLVKIRSRCLVVASPTDGLIASRADLLVARVQSADLRLIGSGHHLHTNHRDAFLGAVMPFLLASGGDGTQRPELASRG
jgi:pimeloyl-ACP methyl ester carboxylesterase